MFPYPPCLCLRTGKRVIRIRATDNVLGSAGGELEATGATKPEETEQIAKSTVTPDARKSSQLETEKDLYPSFLADSKALSAYSPIPSSLVDNLLLHQETTPRRAGGWKWQKGKKQFALIAR